MRWVSRVDPLVVKKVELSVGAVGVAVVLSECRRARLTVRLCLLIYVWRV